MVAGRGRKTGLQTDVNSIMLPFKRSKAMKGIQMDWMTLENHFSAARTGRYLSARRGNKQNAAADYVRNLRLAEAMLPVLSILETALRNGIHQRLNARYHRADWWVCWAGNTIFNWQNRQIADARAKLERRHESHSPDKVVAELTFGFWSSLFNVQFQSILWKDLRLVFGWCPKALRQRRNVSTALNQVRALRNRVFHHESLLWLTPGLPEQHKSASTLIEWINPQLLEWFATHDRLQQVWSEK